jgi:hypothetical protein
MLDHFALLGPGSSSTVRLHHFRAPGTTYGSFWRKAAVHRKQGIEAHN